MDKKRKKREKKKEKKKKKERKKKKEKKKRKKRKKRKKKEKKKEKEKKKIKIKKKNVKQEEEKKTIVFKFYQNFLLKSAGSHLLSQHIFFYVFCRQKIKKNIYPHQKVGSIDVNLNNKRSWTRITPRH